MSSSLSCDLRSTAQSRPRDTGQLLFGARTTDPGQRDEGPSHSVSGGLKKKILFFFKECFVHGSSRANRTSAKREGTRSSAGTRRASRHSSRRTRLSMRSCERTRTSQTTKCKKSVVLGARFCNGWLWKLYKKLTFLIKPTTLTCLHPHILSILTAACSSKQQSVHVLQI